MQFHYFPCLNKDLNEEIKKTRNLISQLSFSLYSKTNESYYSGIMVNIMSRDVLSFNYLKHNSFSIQSQNDTLSSQTILPNSSVNMAFSKQKFLLLSYNSTSQNHSTTQPHKHNLYINMYRYR